MDQEPVVGFPVHYWILADATPDKPRRIRGVREHGRPTMYLTCASVGVHLTADHVVTAFLSHQPRERPPRRHARPDGSFSIFRTTPNSS